MTLSRNQYLFIALIFLIVAVAEFSMGRGWWCPAGDLAFWSGDTNSVHNSQHIIDPYSFTHITHGFLFFLLMWAIGRKTSLSSYAKLFASVSLEAAWEVFENSSWIINRYREATVSLGYYGDSIANSSADIVCMIIGYWLASRLPVKYSIAFVICTEIILLATIRDNLTLNIIMLLAPIPAIQSWQAALNHP